MQNWYILHHIIIIHGGHLNIKMLSYQYGDPYVNGKKQSLYWDGALFNFPCLVSVVTWWANIDDYLPIVFFLLQLSVLNM